MRRITLRNGIRILGKKKGRAILMIILLFLCMYLSGTALSAGNRASDAVRHYEETYGTKTMYFTTENLQDTAYYRYMNEDGTDEYDKLVRFITNLEQTEEFRFVSLNDQAIDLVQEVPDPFLEGYENGDVSGAMNEYEGKKIRSVKTLHVSPSFFDEFSIGIEEGTVFTETEYSYSDGDTIPVLLGSAYKGIFSIGTEMDGYLIGAEVRLRVIGFLADSFFYSPAVNDMISCERYIVMPAVICDSADYAWRASLLQTTNGIVFSSLGYEETEASFLKCMKDAGIEGWNINLIYPDGVGSENILETYSAMTGELKAQFSVIVGVISVFAVVVNIMVLCGMLRENFRTFGVEMLCGASMRDIAFESFTACAVVVLGGSIPASLALLGFGHGIRSVRFVQVVGLAVLVLSCAACGRYIKHMELNSFIGGKE